MAFNLNNYGMEIYLDVKYEPNNTECGSWCKTDFSFKFGDIINYHAQNCEIFINCEVPKLEQFLSDYLDGKLKYGDEFESDDYDFSFKCGVFLIWSVFIWNECDGIWTNSFSTSLNEGQVKKLRDYLRQLINQA